MNKLKKYALSSLYDMASGISSTKEQAGHGSPFVSFSTVFNNYFLPDELPDLMDTSAKEQEVYSIKKGDILITRTSETIDELAMSCVATKDYPCATYSGFTKRLRPKTEGIAYYKYMAFYLRSAWFRKAVTNNAFMTLRASFNEDIFSFLNVYLPDYDVQVRIGDFLYSIEQKIGVNKQICTELESMAKTIYDYWFTQFDFPDADGKPYRSSGGAMVWNEKLKCEIPKGWELVPVIEGYDVCYGFPFDTAKFVNDCSGHPVMRIRDILGRSISAYTTEKVDEKYWLQSGDMVIGMDGNFHISFWDNTQALLNQRCVRIRSKGKLPVFMAYFASLPYIKARERTVSRTTVGHLSADDIKTLYVLCPDKATLDSVRNIFNSALEKICNTNDEIRELTKLRDWLLPMLMNGQATVGD